MTMCQPVNATHCQCRENELMCSDRMCLDSAKFCDGTPDCVDGSDEPDNCNTCRVRLNSLKPRKVISNEKILRLLDIEQIFSGLQR